jgi:ubiquinone/menaquinone biosynthesis C-methylase UbiE
VFDRAAPTYGQVGPDFFSVLGDLLVNRAAVSVGSKVIDVGAGTGAVTEAASRQIGPSGSVFAVDLAPEMLVQLRQRLIGNTPAHVITAVMNAGSLSIRTGSFDVALSGIALQSMSDPQAAVIEMSRVLRSGGHLWHLHFQGMVVARGPSLAMACLAPR